MVNTGFQSVAGMSTAIPDMLSNFAKKKKAKQEGSDLLASFFLKKISEKNFFDFFFKKIG